MTRKISNERARSILAGGSEPQFKTISASMTDMESDLILEKAVHWYRENFNQASARKWIEEYLEREGRDEEAQIVYRISKSNLKLMSPYCRCASRGFPLNAKQKEFIKRNLSEILEDAKTRIPAPTKEKVTVQDRIEAKANEILTILEPLLDEMFDLAAANKKKSNILILWIGKADLNKPMAVAVRTRLEELITEVRLAYNKSDADLVEGYAYLTSRGLKSMVDSLEEAIQNLNDRIGVLRASRKPRKRKAKSADKQVGRLKFLGRNDSFGVDSIDPCVIIGSQGLIMFNIKNNKATVFVAVDPKTGLIVKGSTVVGFDSSKSFEKIVRKPEEFLKNEGGCRKTFTSAVRYLNNVKTKTNEPTGRVNKHCLLLQAQQ